LRDKAHKLSEAGPKHIYYYLMVMIMGIDSFRSNSSHIDFPLSHINAKAIDRVCSLLKKAEITDCNLLHRGSNYVFIVTLVNKRREIKAVYKPRRGETPLYDFPDGTLYKREYAAFLMSQALEWSLVPPTVIRSGPFGIGTVQCLVDTGNRADYDSVMSKDLSRLKQVALFDYLVNNADRKAGHFLEGQDGRLWVVDHGLTFNIVPKLRTVLWDFSGQAIPEKLISDVKSLQQKLKREKLLREILHQLLEVPEVGALEQRLKRIIENPVFSLPESRWSIPWPWT